MVVVAPELFAPTAYYKVIASQGQRAIVDTGLRYDKRRKSVHRYEIVDARGRLQLTVPLGKPKDVVEKPTWHDTPVSTHDEWWRSHRTALESAYGRTPYFEFLIDRFDSVFRSPEEWPKWPSAIDLVRESNRIIFELLAIDKDVAHTDSFDEQGVVDYRYKDMPNISPKPYWQVREHLHGFQDGLSVLDLIFNMGPEAALYINPNRTSSRGRE